MLSRGEDRAFQGASRVSGCFFITRKMMTLPRAFHVGSADRGISGSSILINASSIRLETISRR